MSPPITNPQAQAVERALFRLINAAPMEKRIPLYDALTAGSPDDADCGFRAVATKMKFAVRGAQ